VSDKEPRDDSTTLAAVRAATEASWPSTRVILRVLFIVLVVAVMLWVLVKLTGVILLLVLSIFFAYLVSPLVDFLHRPFRLGGRRIAIPRVMAIALAYLIIVGGIVVVFFLIVPRLGDQFPQFAEQAKGYWKVVGDKTQNLNEYFRLHRMPDPLINAFNNAVPSIVEKVSQTFSLVLTSMVTWVAYIPWLILIPILSFFLLKDAELFRRTALQMLPRGRWRWRGDEFFQDVSRTLAAYTRAQLTACLFIGGVCALGFTLLGLPSPLVLGFIAGLFEFVPLVGPLAVAVLVGIVAALHGGFFSLLLVLTFLGVLRVIQDYIIYPRLIGQGIHLHPLAVILAILSGAELAGVAGIFLAIPVVAILTVSYRHWLEHRGSEGLADLLEGAATTIDVTVPVEVSVTPENEPVTRSRSRPTAGTTPEEMARIRPDLTTGELKIPLED
jgi:predicted PurR-regulated permease PerM